MILDSEKINVSISRGCSLRLQADAQIFDINRSQLFACITLAYCSESKWYESITQEDKNPLEMIQLLLEKSDDMCFPKTIARMIADNDGASLRRSYTKSVTYNWTVSVAAMDALRADRRSHKYGATLLRMLAEEYAELPFAKRERIVLARKIRRIEDLMNTYTPFEYCSLTGEAWVIHPYGFMVDSNLQYNYLVGHTCRRDVYDYDSFKPTISNVSTIRLLSLQEDSLHSRPYCEQKVRINIPAIEEKLAECSPAFLAGDVVTVRVLLNPEGERKYRAILHNRPAYDKKGSPQGEWASYGKNGWVEYVFRCTVFQAVVYFNGFAGHARIIDPPEAVASIREQLRRSYEAYKE